MTPAAPLAGPAQDWTAAEGAGPSLVRNRYLRAEEIDDLVRRYQSGERNIDLARRFEIDPSTVWSHLAERRIESTYLLKVDWPAEKIKEAVDRYRAGATLAEIAEKMGCARNTVRRRLLRAGVELRSRGPKSSA